MYNRIYCLIKKYCDIIPDFALYFKLSKNKKFFHIIYPHYVEDLLQIICVCILSTNTLSEWNRMIAKEIYYFITKIIYNPKIKYLKGKNYYKINNIKYPKPKKKMICDMCKKEKLEYPRKHFDKIICGACKQKVRRLEMRGIYI